MTTAFSFLLAVGLLVFLHEMGHYAAARTVGVYVERFSVGFGPKLVAWRDRRGCEWVLALLPL
ncbi:MAG: RIP metalloprotease RseP, partial [Betaproteobacteria bacterium]|nr:RIP metalloprotease RseP [Betaproteobacteria bacterium]